MKKKYLVEFKEANGNTYEFEFNTDDISLSIEQYCRNRHIVEHRIINEGAGGKNKCYLVKITSYLLVYYNNFSYII